MSHHPHDDVMAEVFRQNPAYAVALLNSLLADGKIADVVVALRQMAKAFGGLPQMEEQIILSPNLLGHTLDDARHPNVSSLLSMLKAMS